MVASLPDRFNAPAGWRTHSFTNPETGHRLFYGSVFPQRKEPPGAVIVCLPGLSEFTEKYYELAHSMLDRGNAFWCMDWQYQGRSGRLPNRPHRRHSDGFETDVSDLHKLVADYVKPSSVHPDQGRIPMIMLGHSMGAHIGLRFLCQYPKFFDGAAFSAPFLGIYRLTSGSKFLTKAVVPFLPVVEKFYIPSGRDWHEALRKGNGEGPFSSDPVRDGVHNAWCKADTALQVGSVTYGFVIRALKSCAYFLQPGVLDDIKIPVLAAIAGEEQIVDNTAAKAIIKGLPQGELIEIPGAKHEIFMEKDIYRNVFLKAFDKMVERNKIATLENLKPF